MAITVFCVSKRLKACCLWTLFTFCPKKICLRSLVTVPMREIASEEHLQALFSLSAAMQYVAATIFLSGTAGIYCVNTTNQEKGGSQ